MPDAKVETRFDPVSLKANKKNEAIMYLSIHSSNDSKTYWCECDINVSAPLSLAHDKELNMGHTRIGLLKPKGKIEKPIKLYTTPNNIIANYPVSIIAYLYDDDGTIAERIESSEQIKCEA
jgi:hypothetical protein